MTRRLKHRIGLSAAVVAAVAASAAGAVQTNGPALSLAVTTNAAGNRSVVVTLSPTGTVEVTPYAPDVVRVRFHFGGLFDREEVAIAKPFTNWPAFAATFTSLSATNFLIETSQLQVELVLSNRFQVHFKDTAGRDLLRDVRMEYDDAYHPIDDTNGYAQVNWPGESSGVSNPPSGFKLKAVKVMPANEAYFGLGDFGGPLNRRGQTLQFWTQDTYQFGEFRNPKYTALPFWYGAQGPSTSRAAFAYGVFFHNPARPVVDLAGAGGTYAFHAGDDQLDYFFFGGGADHAMPAILDRYSELTGRPAFLPKWAYGYHQSRHTYFTQQAVLDLMSGFRTNDIPCDAIHLDIGVQDGASQNHQLTFNGGFSNVPAMVAHGTNLGFQLVPLVEPLLTTNDPLYPHAFTNLYFLKQNDLNTYVGTNFLGRISWLDYSIAQTRAWWAAQLTNYLATYGFAAIWNDLTEPNENSLPLNAIWFLDGRYGGGLVTDDTRKWHSNNKNTYSVLASQVSYEALRTRRPDLRPFVLTRSAWPGVQRYAAGWSGDNISSFDHLRFSVRTGLSVLMSGQPHYGHDVGGFVSNAVPELLTRWIQSGALQPLFRNHSGLWTADQEPWVWGDPYTLWNRRWIKFRYEIMPYLYTLASETATNGMPVNAPTVAWFPSDTNTWGGNEGDFMVGRDLLAAPVAGAGAVTRAVYLPAGADWFHWSDHDARYAGGQSLTVLASLGGLPLFARAGAIVPMGPAMDYAGAIAPDYLDLHVWPGGTNGFTLYEDDGATTNYLAGAWAKTPIALAGGGDQLALTVGPRSGPFDPGARAFYVVAHAMSNVVGVTANGAALERYANRGELEAAAADGWSYDTVSRQAVVRIADTGAQVDVLLLGDAQAPTDVVFASSFTNLAVAGTFNYWNEGARNMRLVGDHRWAFVTDLTGHTNIEFKFVGNDAWAVTNWGDTNQLLFTVPFTMTADANGNNIAASNLAAGVYTFTFNETNRRYSVTAAALADSDGDGMADEWEYTYGLHPALASDAGMDLDGDGLANSNEYAAGSSPVRTDSDDDGVSDLGEWIAGTSPTNASAFFAVAAHTLDATNAGAVVTWMAVTGRTYELFFGTSLLDGAWSTLQPFGSVTGSGSVSVTDTNPAGGRVYRLGVQRDP